jgi:hypothetical protein
MLVCSAKIGSGRTGIWGGGSVGRDEKNVAQDENRSLGQNFRS